MGFPAQRLKERAHRTDVRRRPVTHGPQTCYWCRERPGLTRDHVRPVAFGGSNHPGNIVMACMECNQERGTLTAAYIALGRANLHTGAAAEVVLRAAKMKLAILRKRVAKWTALEVERLRWSPTACYGTPALPYPLRLKPLEWTPKSPKKRWRLADGEERYRFWRDSLMRWADDGGRA